MTKVEDDLPPHPTWWRSLGKQREGAEGTVRATTSSMDLSFLRVLTSRRLPASVPPGPAFQFVLAYQAARLIEANIPPRSLTPSGRTVQEDAIVTTITELGWTTLEAGVAKRAMTEIRICWTEVAGHTRSQPSEGGLWIPETSKNRDELEAYVEAGNQGFGQGTHWIERREA